MEILDYCMNEYVKLSMKEFSLNPLHYVSLPGYSFDCWLMSSDVTLDTLQDKKILDDFVEAKKAGICGIMGVRYINNVNEIGNGIDNDNGKTMAEHDRRSIWYIDANNLYGYAMVQKLLYKDFEYYSTSLDNGDTMLRHILNTCDINYTNSCKDRTEHLALMSSKRKKNHHELGYRERERGSTLGHPKSRARSEKLILDQNKRREYMFHYRMLKFYVKMGVKVTKFYIVFNIKQDYICSDYIQNNTNKRATANTEAEKDVRKLMNNSLYGRMCMNPLRFLQIKFLHDEEEIIKSISKPNFKYITRNTDNSQIEYITKKNRI